MNRFIGAVRGGIRIGEDTLMRPYIKPLSLLVVALLLASVLLAGCAGQAQEEQPEAVTEPFETFIPVVSATGELVPARWATVSSVASGMVVELLAEEGDRVEADQVLARLGSRESLEAAVAAAQLELVSATQALEDLHLNAAMMASQAQLELANAQADLEDEESDWLYEQEGHRAADTTIDAAEAELALARESKKRAKKIAHSCGSSNDADCAQEYKDLAAAVQREWRALANLNWYTGHPTETEQAQLDAELSLAKSRVEQAQLEWEKWRNGPAQDELELAQARLSNAEAQLATAEAALEHMEIRAPFAGTISDLFIRIGEWVSPGMPIVVLADLELLQVETTDLNELDVARIEVGDPATVTFDALPEVEVQGTVTRIAPKADEGSGVNYTVVIELSELPETLRWSMTAFVDIEVEE